MAEFLGNIIAKYADVIDIESLPDPNIYLTHRGIRNAYRKYAQERNKRKKLQLYIEVEYMICYYLRRNGHANIVYTKGINYDYQ